eukprot:comp21241_c1_seq1/m.28927 comp21241_c1_seq1/g.28927  ORF comp21241_c1_seq1/g.28927 comp21241_c1_seq1/m.28927 type:complete len:301 (-) comp21241_c1_seq1:404-1306(-)
MKAATAAWTVSRGLRQASALPRVGAAVSVRVQHLATAAAQPEPTATQAAPKMSSQPQHRLKVATVLERYEVLTRDLSPFEQQYKEFADMIHVEKSKYSIEEVFALAAQQGTKKEEKGKGKGKQKQKKGAAAAAETPAEEEQKPDANTQAWTQEAKKDTFVPASRITEADQSNDRHSTDRRLQDVLYLIVKAKKGGWILPEGDHEGVENMRKTAERTLKAAVDGSGGMTVSYLSNAPLGMMPSPPTTPDEKVFFFHAHWLAGSVQVDSSKYEDFAWVTATEMKEYVTPEYFASVRPLLREL